MVFSEILFTFFSLYSFVAHTNFIDNHFEEDIIYKEHSIYKSYLGNYLAFPNTSRVVATSNYGGLLEFVDCLNRVVITAKSSCDS